MRIVFLCEDPSCPYPDLIVAYPVDDNRVCECGRTKWGHHSFKVRPLPCPICGSRMGLDISEDGWPYCMNCGGTSEE